MKYCIACERPYFDSPSSCVEVLVINEHNQVLLLKQNYISKSHWGVVSGYVNKYIARVNNMSGIHFDNSMRLLNLHNLKNWSVKY